MKRNFTVGEKKSIKSHALIMCVRVCVLSLFSCVQLFAIWTTARQAPVYTAIFKMDNQQRPTV